MSTPQDRTAASYARAGREVGPQALSDQHSRNAQFAETDGFVTPDVFRFEYIGSAVDKHRPGLQSLLDAAEGDAAFSRLYVSDWTRLSRSANPRHLWCMLGRFAASGVQAYQVSRPVPGVAR